MKKYAIKFDIYSPKYIHVYNKIKKMIDENTLEKNEKLPSIRELSKFLGVNSSTIVKAYELLKDNGYVYKKGGSGTFVFGKKYHDETKVDRVDTDNLYRLDTGNPSSDIFPIEEFKQAINMALENDYDNIFDYDENFGVDELKETLVKYLKSLNIESEADNLLIVSGAQQGIDIVCKALIDYLDIVFLETPTYNGALNVLKTRNAKLINIPMLEDGIDLGILKMKLEKSRPKLLYVMPNFQNPTGISYSEYKKKKIIELAEEFDFYILEDDFISDFKFISENNRTLKSYDIYDRVIYIKSFSKILMPGLRVGVVCMPKSLLRRALESKYSSDISTSTLIQKSLYYYMEHFEWKKHLDIIENIYTDRFIQSKEYIENKLSGNFSIIKSTGGINFYLKLNDGYRSSDYFEFLLSNGVSIQPGTLYSVNPDDESIRINIAKENIIRIKEAIDIMSNTIDEFYKNYTGGK